MHAGHDARSSASAGTSFPITAVAARRGSTGFSVFSNGRLTIGDSMRELAFADYFAMPFPPFTQSLWLLRASFTPSCLCHSDADASPPAIQSLPASFAPFAVGLFWVLVKNKTLRQVGAKQERNKMSKNKPAEIATNKPAHEIRINGIRATIWKNETEKGPRYNTTFERNYKDGEAWKTSDSYGREDLLLLAYMAREAFAWIAKQPTK